MPLSSTGINVIKTGLLDQQEITHLALGDSMEVDIDETWSLEIEAAPEDPDGPDARG